MECESLTVFKDGVTGIVAAIETRDNAIFLWEIVHELAFPFVAPLGAQDDAHSGVDSVEAFSDEAHFRGL
jgi:hypothetical protein